MSLEDHDDSRIENLSWKINNRDKKRRQLGDDLMRNEVPNSQIWQELDIQQENPQ